MEVIVKRACGLDVHQKSVTGCILRQGYPRQIRTFDTTTRALRELKQWLVDERITHVAMESTGVYWKPVFNVLGDDFELLLVNARHVKHVPGRKTDVLDAEWLCKLLRAGLLRGSYIPKLEVRRLRDLTRYQKKLQHQIQNEKNRVHKILQDANIKLTSVLSDIFGKTGRTILDELSCGKTDAKELSSHFDRHRGLRHSAEEAEEALTNCVSAHHQVLLKGMLAHIDFLQQQIDEFETVVRQLIEQHFAQEYELLQTMPGVSNKAAAAILSELGGDMDAFPSSVNLAAWAGLCPSQKESAGKKKVPDSGKATTTYEPCSSSAAGRR
ncbi:MAG: IS110 family transposase [Bacteroidota bacterium]